MLSMSPLINLMHLKFFCDAVSHKSVSEAAKLNYVTQSAVSQAISKLEKIIGTDLIVHNRQKFQVTEEGYIVFEQARHIFKAVQDTYDKVAQNKQEIVGKLNFVTTHSLTLAFIPHLFQKAKEQLPGLSLYFHSGNLTHIRQALKNDEAEFAIVVYDQSFSQFAKIPLKEGKFNLYQPENGPHHLLEEGVFVDNSESLFVKELLRIKRNKTSLFSIKGELIAWETIARFVELGLGVGFLPDYIAENRYPTLQIIPHKSIQFTYQICAIHKKETKLSRAALAFLDLLAHYKN